MASLSIKVRRIDMINALEARKVAIPKDIEAYDKAKQKYEADMIAWAKKSLKAGLVEIQSLTSWHRQPNLVFSDKALATKPEEPKSVGVSVYSKEHLFQEIDQALKVLRLSDEEYVPATVSRNLSHLI